MSEAAVAQNVQQADLEQCASLATAALKLACYENLTATGAEPTEPAVTSEATEMPDAVVASEATAERDTSDTANSVTPLAAGAVAAEPDPDLARSGPDATSMSPGAPVEGSGAVAAGVVADSADAKADSAAATTTSSSVESGSASPSEGGVQRQDIPEEFGRKYLGEQGEPETATSLVTATVIEVEQRRNKVLYFYFENGQVWRQVEGRRFNYPRSGKFDVTINTGMMGDYRLRLAAGGPMTIIKRVR